MALQQSMLRLKVHSACSASTSAERKLDKLLKQGALHTAMAGQGALTPSNVTTRALCSKLLNTCLGHLFHVVGPFDAV